MSIDVGYGRSIVIGWLTHTNLWGVDWFRLGVKTEVKRSTQGFNSLYLHQTALGLRVHPPHTCGI